MLAARARWGEPAGLCQGGRGKGYARDTQLTANDDCGLNRRSQSSSTGSCTWADATTLLSLSLEVSACCQRSFVLSLGVCFVRGSTV